MVEKLKQCFKIWHMKIHERLHEARSRAGLSMSEIARRLGVSPQSVQQWESGTTTPRPQRIRDLAALLGVTEGYLLGAGEELAAAAEAGALDATGTDPARDNAQALTESIIEATEHGRLTAEDLGALAYLVDRLQSR